MNMVTWPVKSVKLVDVLGMCCLEVFQKFAKFGFLDF